MQANTAEHAVGTMTASDVATATFGSRSGAMPRPQQNDQH
jgi:hypothetical protein